MELGQPQEPLGIVPGRFLTLDAPAVQSHLTMLQGIIGRLAYNSASSKTWCVSLVSALVVVVAGTGRPLSCLSRPSQS